MVALTSVIVVGASARPVCTWGTDILPDIATVLVEISAVPPAQLACHPPSAVHSAMRSSASYLGRHCINPIGPLILHLVVVCFFALLPRETVAYHHLPHCVSVLPLSNDACGYLVCLRAPVKNNQKICEKLCLSHLNLIAFGSSQ